MRFFIDTYLDATAAIRYRAGLSEPELVLASSESVLQQSSVPTNLVNQGTPMAITDCVTYTVAEAKNKLPELIRQYEAGTPVTITKRGISVVEIVRKVEDTRRKPVFGVLGRKKIVLDPDWARPQEDIDA